MQELDEEIVIEDAERFDQNIAVFGPSDAHVDQSVNVEVEPRSAVKSKRNLISNTIGMLLIITFIVVSIVVSVNSGTESEEVAEEVAVVDESLKKKTVVTMDTDPLMKHNLTYYVSDDILHLDIWMGYPEPNLLGGFTLY